MAMPSGPLKLQNLLESGVKVPTCLASPPTAPLIAIYSFQAKLLTARTYLTYCLAVFLSQYSYFSPGLTQL